MQACAADLSVRIALGHATFQACPPACEACQENDHHRSEVAVTIRLAVTLRIPSSTPSR